MTQPRWFRHSRNWIAFQKRLQLNTGFGSILNAISPTVQLDRVWHREYYQGANGAFGQSWDIHIEGDAPYAGSRYHSCSLHNPTDDLELLVYRAWGQASQAIGAAVATVPRSITAMPNVSLHISTPPESYFELAGSTNSVVNTAGTRFGWKQGAVGPQLDSVILPAAHVDCYTHTTLPIVSVNGVNNYALGPMMLQPGNATAQGQTNGRLLHETSDQPPWRVKPGQRLMIQSVQPLVSTALGARQFVVASFEWVERPWVEG